MRTAQLAIALVLGITLCRPLLAQTDKKAKAAPSNAPAIAAAHEEAALVVWNRTITVFRANFEQLGPAQRAAGAEQRIKALPDAAQDWRIEAKEMTIGEHHGMLITVDGQLMFGILPGDLDPESGETLQHAADQAVLRLREVLVARAEQRRWPVMLRGIVLASGATIIFLLALWGVVLARRWLLARVERLTQARRLEVAGVDLRPQVHSIERGAVRLAALVVGLMAAYLWLTYVLNRFPYSSPWGGELRTFLLNLLETLALGVLKSVPGIFTVLVIFLVTRGVVRLVGGFFQSVEDGRLAVHWLQPETAKATRRLVMVLIWIFALTVAYPYVPGSNTDAFKGISVFVGLMVSLGSAGLVNQVMSGLVVVYARAFKPGDFVRIGDSEGRVSEVGMLSTKLVTRKREEITFPNAVLVGTTAVNYSRLAGEQGAVVSTSVTIGYDAPWRQVHALLLLAAERTANIRREPRPYVLQKALTDFYAEYQLFFHLDRPEERLPVLSELHGQIQDAFNEFDVQIMSPNFEAQPERPVLVPPSKWHAAPAAPGPPANGAVPPAAIAGQST